MHCINQSHQSIASIDQSHRSINQSITSINRNESHRSINQSINQSINPIIKSIISINRFHQSINCIKHSITSVNYSIELFFRVSLGRRLEIASYPIVWPGLENWPTGKREKERSKKSKFKIWNFLFKWGRALGLFCAAHRGRRGSGGPLQNNKNFAYLVCSLFVVDIIMPILFSFFLSLKHPAYLVRSLFVFDLIMPILFS